MILNRIGVLCFLATYAVALVLEWLRLASRSSIHRFATIGCGTIGLLTHSIYLFVRSSTTGLPPLLSSSHDWLLVLAWLVIVFYLFLTIWDRELAVGVFVLPIVLLLIVSTYFVSDTPNERLNSLRGWKMLHASLLVLGMLGVLIGFILAMMYLVQQRRLRHRQTHLAGFGIPNLEKLARLNRWSVIIAVPLLTLGMGTGVGLGLYSKSSTEPVQFQDPVIIGSGIAWLVMVVLFIRLMTTTRATGRQVASQTLWACGFLLVTLIGLQVATGKKVLELKSWHVSETKPRSTIET